MVNHPIHLLINFECGFLHVLLTSKNHVFIKIRRSDVRIIYRYNNVSFWAGGGGFLILVMSLVDINFHYQHLIKRTKEQYFDRFLVYK